MNEEKSTLRQGVNQFIDTLFEIFHGESMDEIVSKHQADALDISKIHLPQFTPSPELTNVVKNTSMETRRDLKLSFPPSNFSKNDPLTLYYTQLYQAVAYYTALICSNEEIANIFIEEMENRGVDADNIDDFLNSEWALGAKLAKLPQMAELTKSMPDYADFNPNKPQNHALIDAKRKIEHTKNGKIVENISLSDLEHDTPDIANQATANIFVSECLSILTEEEKALLTRHANGETYESLATDFGYQTASGVRKKIERIKQKIIEKTQKDSHTFAKAPDLCYTASERK